MKVSLAGKAPVTLTSGSPEPDRTTASSTSPADPCCPESHRENCGLNSRGSAISLWRPCQVDSDCTLLDLQSLNCIAPCGQLVGIIDTAAITTAAFAVCNAYFAAGCPERALFHRLEAAPGDIADDILGRTGGACVAELLRPGTKARSAGSASGSRIEGSAHRTVLVRADLRPRFRTLDQIVPQRGWRGRGGRLFG
jgi:hypothetical protein